MTSTQSVANKIHYETLEAAWSSGRQLQPEQGEWSVLTEEPGGVDYVEVSVADKTALWVLPKGAAKDRVMVYIHGGGYVGGSIWTHRKMVGHLAKAIGCTGLLITYDYTFKSKFPRQVEQATAAFDWLAGQGVAPKYTIAAGDSVGGGLSVAAVLKLRDAGKPLPGAVVGLSGWYDMTMSGASYAGNSKADAFFQRDTVAMLATQLLDGVDPKTPLASPIFADLKGLPPIYLQAGGDEALLDDSHVLTDRAKAAGVDVRLDVFPAMLHTFQMMAGRAPEADDAIGRIAEWVRPKVGLVA